MDSGAGDARRRSPRPESVDAAIRLGEVADDLILDARSLLTDEQLKRLERHANLGARVHDHQRALELRHAYDAQALAMQALRDEHEYERQGRTDAYELELRRRRDAEDERAHRALHRVDLAARWLRVGGQALILAVGAVSVYYWALTGDGPVDALRSLVSWPAPPP